MIAALFLASWLCFSSHCHWGLLLSIIQNYFSCRRNSQQCSADPRNIASFRKLEYALSRGFQHAVCGIQIREVWMVLSLPRVWTWLCFDAIKSNFLHYQAHIACGNPNFKCGGHESFQTTIPPFLADVAAAFSSSAAAQTRRCGCT